LQIQTEENYATPLTYVFSIIVTRDYLEKLIGRVARRFGRKNSKRAYGDLEESETRIKSSK